jgi:hypothetical protein
VEYLFSNYDLYAIGENAREQLVEAINSADVARVSGREPKEVAAEFAEQLRLDIPALIERAISVDVEEAQVDVSHDPNRAILRPGPFHVPGIRVTYFVPFAGDANAFKCRPSTYTTQVPAVDEVRKGALVSGYERADTRAEATKEHFDRDLSLIEQYLEWVTRDANAVNESLPGVALQAVSARQQRLADVAKSPASLGVPIRRAGSSLAPAVTSDTHWRRTCSTRARRHVRFSSSSRTAALNLSSATRRCRTARGYAP